MDIDAERAERLFKAIVAQALIDATSTPRAVSFYRKVPRADNEGWCDWLARRRETLARREAIAISNESKDRNEARIWLTRDADNFPLVTSLAGYNPDDIRQRSRKLEAAGWAA